MNIERRKLLRYFLGARLFGAVACYPVFIERYIILINEYRIHFPNLPKEFSGLRIVHLTDLHYGALMPLRIIENVVQRVNKLKKDIVVCTGDYVHERNSIVQIDQVWPVLSRLQAKFGVLFVMGNHDHLADTDRSLYWSERSGQNLRGKVKAIEKNGKRLWIAGGGDLWEDHIGFDEILSKVPDNEFRIMLAHNPDSSDTQFDGHIDLLLAGHTHGGKCESPFWVLPSCQ